MGTEKLEQVISDVVIVGAGGSGLSAAVAAAGQGAKVLVIEKRGIRLGVQCLCWRDWSPPKARHKKEPASTSLRMICFSNKCNTLIGRSIPVSCEPGSIVPAKQSAGWKKKGFSSSCFRCLPMNLLPRGIGA